MPILERIEMTVDGSAMDRQVLPYGRLFFDHLYSEYLTLKHAIIADDLVKLLEGINQKRQNHELTWSDIYTFDLTLVDARPPESLIRKHTMRAHDTAASPARRNTMNIWHPSRRICPPSDLSPMLHHLIQA